MRIVVPVKQVPDLVEELELNSEETDVDREFLKFVVSEWDDQALEEALLVKDATGGEVVVVGFDDPDVDMTLYTALAKGADRAVKLTGMPEGGIDSHTRAAVLAEWISGASADLVLTGVQAVDDLDGQLPPILGARLGWPHVSVVVSVEAKDGVAHVTQEFSGGVAARLEIHTPAVIGIQAARQAPRYASITRIRQAQQAGGLEEVDVAVPAASNGVTVRRLYVPEKTGHAEMLTGSVEEVAERIIELVRAKGVLKG
ncbi:MAG TPA: electron transfer flavoprotein subunit beta/FixA family protein [Acidimicrobiia bacterium]|nr:electron transfer flavoprotein subunit beta/FixA family protein [Acidimicrobiia bacterium]